MEFCDFYDSDFKNCIGKQSHSNFLKNINLRNICRNTCETIVKNVNI